MKKQIQKYKTCIRLKLPIEQLSAETFLAIIWSLWDSSKNLVELLGHDEVDLRMKETINGYLLENNKP